MPSAHYHGGTAGARLPSQTWPSPARSAVQTHQPHEHGTLLTQRTSWARTARSLPVAGLENVGHAPVHLGERLGGILLLLFADLSAPFRPHIRHLGHTPAQRVLGWSNTVLVPFVHAPPLVHRPVHPPRGAACMSQDGGGLGEHLCREVTGASLEMGIARPAGAHGRNTLSFKVPGREKSGQGLCVWGKWEKIHTHVTRGWAGCHKHKSKGRSGARVCVCAHMCAHTHKSTCECSCSRQKHNETLGSKVG